MRTRLVVAIAAAVSLVASLSFAGDYHFGQDLICSDCHVMHYSQSHGYNPNGSGIFTPLAGGPHHYLLRNDINDLCLSCHDGQAFAPDVFEAHSNGYVREAGALNEVGGNGLYPPPTGHTLGSTDVAPGGTFSDPNGLNCADCHAPHGRTRGTLGTYAAQGGYRNLFVDDPNFVSITYTRFDVEGANDLGAWVHEQVSSGVSASHYGVPGITFNEPVVTESRYADMCQKCHTNFHGTVGGPEIGGTGTPPVEFVRHPNLTANIGAVGGGHSSGSRFTGKGNQVFVMSPTGQKPSIDGVAGGGYDTVADAGLTPSCMSCHKGHGNQNAFGLIYMLGTGTLTEQGDNGIDARNMCRQCHGMGGNSTAF